MASTLDFIKEKFPKISAFSDSNIARSLYRRNFEDVQDEFDDEDDYVNFLLTGDTGQVPDTQRFGKYVSYEGEQPEEEAGILETIVPSFKKGFLGLEATGRGALAGLAGEGEYQEEQLRKAQEVEAEQAGMIPDYIESWRDIGGIGDLTRYAIQKFGESSPWMGAAIAGGAAGSFIPGLGTIAGMGIGALAGSTAALSPMFFGQNILRQAEQVRAGQRQDINEATAALAAPAQALLDSIIYRFIPAKLRGTTSKNIFRKALKGGVVGVPTEAVTEVGQQFIERLQAGLPLADEQAMREYEESAVAGGLLGGVVGGATGPFNVATTSVEDQKKADQIQKTKTEFERITEEASTPLELTEQEKIEQRDIAQPTSIGREEEQPIEIEQASQLQQEGRQDGNKLFIGDMLTEKLQSIIDTQGEQAAREYYKGFSETFLTTRRTKAPAFESASKKVKKPITTPQVGQTRFNVDEVSTDQFEEGIGYVVRDNKIDGEDSLAFRTKEEADTYITDKGSPQLTKEDLTIPPKPGEGFAWDSKQKRWVDQWTGQRGTTPLKKTTVKEKRIPINLTDLSAKDQRKIDYHRNTVNRRKDKDKYPNTDLTEMIDSGVVPKDARLVENLTAKQQTLLKNRRTTKKDQWWTTDQELGSLGVIPAPEIKADAETKRQEKKALEQNSFDVDFEIAQKEDGRFQVNKLLKDQETGNVVQEVADSIHTDENNAGRRLRDLQQEIGVEGKDVDVTAGKPLITLEELKARDRSEGKILSTVTEFIKRETAKIAGPETGVVFATDKIVAPEGSYGFESSEGTVGDIEGFYDESNDIIYLSLQNTTKLLNEGNLDQLVSHESFHALQRTIKNAKKNVFTVKEQNALNEAFPEGTVDQLPDSVKKVLGNDAMALLRQRHGNTVIRPDEMQAYVFQVWNAQKQRGKRLPVGNIVQRAFNKISNVLTKTKRFLQGKGYNTWESVFEAAAEGEVGRRGVPKTEAEAKAIGERRAREIAEAKETVPISEIEGKRSVTPLGEIKASISPTTVYPKSNVRGTINSNNPIFRPLGFRPSQEAMSILNNAADMIVETKKGKVPQTETERVNRSADMQPAYNEINNFKNKLISEKPEQENVVREMLQPMVNAAVAVRHGHKFDITDPNTGDSVTIGSGELLIGKDAEIHKDLSNVRINRKPLYRAINEGFFPRTEEEQQVKRTDIERDEVAERSKARADKVLKDRQIEGTTEEEVTEQREQTDARRAIEGKRPILKLPKTITPKFSVSDGKNAIDEAKVSQITLTAPEKIFKQISGVANPSEASVRPVSDLYVDVKEGERIPIVPAVKVIGTLGKYKVTTDILQKNSRKNFMLYDENDQWVGSLELAIGTNENELDLQAISVPSDLQGQGLGTAILQEIHKLADAEGVTIIGVISPYNRKGLNKTQLRKWYKNNGYKVDSADQITREPTTVSPKFSVAEKFEVPEQIYKIKEPFTLALSVDEMIEGAKESKDAKTWYTKHKEILDQLLGVDSNFFEELIGITSQQASVDENINRAMMAYEYYKDNGSFKLLKEKNKNVLKPTKHHLPLLKGVIQNLQRMEGLRPPAELTIREQMGFEPTKTTFGIQTYFGGKKVPDFVEALFLNTDEVVTIDRHMVQLIFGKDAKENKASFLEAKRVVTKIANELGWTPKETQAALWSFNQVRTRVVKAKQKSLEEVRDYEKALRDQAGAIEKLVAKYKQTDFQEQVSDTRRQGESVPTRGTTSERIKASVQVSNHFDGANPDIESEDKLRVDTADGFKFSTQSLFGNITEEGLKSIEGMAVEERSIRDVNALSNNKLYQAVNGKYGPRGVDLRVKLQDKLYGLRRIQDKIEQKYGKKIPNQLNAYLAEELYWGRTGERLHQLKVQNIEPINDLLAENKITTEEVDLFLVARHAKERNKYILKTWDEADALRNTKNRTEEQEQRYKQIKSYLENTREQAKSGSGMTDAEANRYLDYYKGRADGKVFNQIGEKIDALMRQELDIKLDGNLISKEQYDNIVKGDFKNYVPLAGLDFDIDVDNPKMGGSGVPVVETKPRRQTVKRTSGFQVKDLDPKIKKGRGALGDETRIATNTYAQAVAKINNSIIRAEKNKVALTFNEFAKKYFNDETIVNDNLFIIDPTEEQINSFDADKKEYDDLRQQKRIFKTIRPNPGHKFEFLEDGQKRTILLTNDYLARALKDTGVESGNKFLNLMSNATRYLAVINTAFSPEFIVTNAIKDIQTAGINLSDEQTVDFRNNTIKNWRNALRAARRVEKDPQAKGDWEDSYRNYSAAGGKVGFFTSMKTPDVLLSEIQKDINQLSSEKASKFYLNPKGKAKKLIKLISRTNTAVENAIRLSAFQSALDAGVNIEEAASLAKNLTVNFNRKGEWGGAINSLYLFYNASIQGSFRLFQAIGRSKKVRNIALGIVATSFFLDMFNRALAEDDEDGRNKYDKINGWTKGHNLIFMNPFDVGPSYVALPMPWGYNWLAIVGQTMSSSMPEDMGGSRKNEITIGENAARTGMGLIDAFSPVPVGNNFADVVAPAVVKPAVQLIMNEDYAGRAIYPPDNPFDGNAGPPDSQTHWNASTPSTLIAQTLNNLTGGSPVRSGIADFHPDTLDFIAKQVGGSAGLFGLNTVDLGLKILSGNWDEISLNRVPFVRKFFKSQPSFINKQTYFDIRDEIKIAENLIEYLTDERQFTEARKAKIDNRQLLRLSPALKSLESKRRQIRKAIQKIEESRGLSDDAKKDRIKMLFEREEKLLAIFIRRADKLLN